MNVHDTKPVGRSYGVRTKNGWVTYKNGLIKTYANEKAAQKVASKLEGSSVGLLRISEPISLPASTTVDIGRLQASLSTVQKMLDSGIPNVHKWDVEYDSEYNVLRHFPLGAKRVNEVGDSTNIVKLSVILTADSVLLGRVFAE